MMFGKQKEFGFWFNAINSWKFRKTADAIYIRFWKFGLRLPIGA